MMRWVKVEEVGDTEFLIEEQVDKFRFQEENERVLGARRPAGEGPAAAARHHEGVALDRLVHLGGVVPGDDARAHRGVDLRQGRLPARPEGERHDGPADPGGHGLRVVQARARFRADEPPPPPPPSPEELEAQREMDDYADADFNFKDDIE